MANYTELKTAVSAVIKTNNNQEITGQLLQGVLNNIISVIGANAAFAGIATPSTNPGTPDGPVFYLATQSGTYSNFNQFTVEPGEIGIFVYKTSWQKQSIKYEISEVNVSKIYPTGGIDGTNKYTLETAIAKIPSSLRNVGLKCSFLDKDGELETWEFRGDRFTSLTNWKICDAVGLIQNIEKNLYNLYRLKWGQGGIQPNGVYMPLSAEYEVTDYIPVAPGIKLIVDVFKGRTDTYNCAYDKDKKFISVLSDTGEITIPENAYYVRINNKVSYSQRSIYFDGSALLYKSDLKGIQNTLGELVSANNTITNLVYAFNLESDLHQSIKTTVDTALNYNNGNTSTYPLCTTSDYIDVSKYKSLQLTGIVCASNYEVALACFYNSEKVFISSIRYDERNKVLNKIIAEIPDNAAYMRFSYNTYNINDFDKADVYVALDNSILSSLTTIGINNYFKDNDLFDFNLGDYITISNTLDTELKSDGTTAIYARCVTTNFVNISGFKKILVKNAVCNTNHETMLACFYDSDERLIENGVVRYSIRGTEQVDILISVPENAVYARFSANIYQVSNFKSLELYSTIQYKHIKEDISRRESKPYAGKKILSLGDSYTYLNYYGKYLAEATGCEQRGRGVNGNFLNKFVGDKYTGPSGKEVTEVFDAELLSDYDIVTVIGGTNDYGHSTHTLGSLETMEEDALLEGNCKTIYGAVYYIINKILTLKPSIRIYFCTQPFRLPYENEAKGPGGYEENKYGLSMEKIADAIINVCGHFGIPVFDFYRNSGWNPWTIKFKNPESPSMGDVVDNIYTYDGLHPKNGKGNGADLLGTSFGKFINSH